MTSRLSFLAAATLGEAIGLLSANAVAEKTNDNRPAMNRLEGDGPIGRPMTPEEREAFLDAKIAAVRSGLTLTAHQEKLWPPVERAIHNTIAQMREERQKMSAASDEADKSDPIARVRRLADRAQVVARNLSEVADAAQPFFLALNDDQRWRLRTLLHAIRMHGANSSLEMMQDGSILRPNYDLKGPPIAEAIKEGDVVQLKSGGPKMTVRGVSEECGEHTALCDWFGEDKKQWKNMSGKFSVVSLKLAAKEK